MPGNLSHNLPIPEEHTSSMKGRDRAPCWINSVTTYLQFTSVCFGRSPDHMWHDSEWWTKLLNNFSVLFPFEGKVRAERKKKKGNLDLFWCPGVTLPWPHFLPGLSLQSNCFLLWRHFKDSRRQMLLWLAIASSKRLGENDEAFLMPRRLGSASQWQIWVGRAAGEQPQRRRQRKQQARGQLQWQLAVVHRWGHGWGWWKINIIPFNKVWGNYEESKNESKHFQPLTLSSAVGVHVHVCARACSFLLYCFYT